MHQALLANATIAAPGNALYSPDIGPCTVNLIINVSAAPTGGSPALTFTMQDVDPGDGATPLGPQVAVQLNAQGSTSLSLAIRGACKVSWAVSGSFTGVNATTEVAAGASVAIAGYPARSYSASLAAASSIIKATPGTLYALKIRNRNAAARFVMLFNQATVPADGAVTPFDIFLVPAASQLILGADYLTLAGLALGTGISIAVSSTDSLTKTLATPADHDIFAAFA